MTNLGLLKQKVCCNVWFYFTIIYVSVLKVHECTKVHI